MCLAIPVRITEISADGTVALTELSGVIKEASLALVDDEVAVGDYIIVHVGFALKKLNVAEAENILALFTELAQGISQ